MMSLKNSNARNAIGNPAQELRAKCLLNAKAPNNGPCSTKSKDNQHESSSIGIIGSTGAAASKSGTEIKLNPDAKEFIPRNVMEANSSSGRSRSPMALLLEEQVVASLPGGNEVDEGKAGTLLSQASTSAPQMSAPPLGRSYAQAAGFGISRSSRQEALDCMQELCPYAMNGECRFGDKCVLLHGLRCEYCQKGCLHPTNKLQNELHEKACIEQHKIDMEHSFAVARSADKTCGICMETVMEKTARGDRRFGILPACNHCYCLSCIRQWRKAEDFENKVIRSCPQCRVSSDYVCPSRVWIESKEEKEKLFKNYKQALRQKECRYYRHGDGICPFGNKCFYRHTNTSGIPVDIGPPIRLYDRNGRRPTSLTGVSVSRYLQDYGSTWAEDLYASDDDSSEYGSEFGDSYFDFI